MIRIHREGKGYIISALFLTLVATLTGYQVSNGNSLATGLTFAFFFVIFLLIVNFFRNPKRSTPRDGNIIYAPCDGKVVVVEETVEEEWFNGPRRQISIFMSPLNVHVNYAPVGGTVKHFKYHPGKYLAAWHPKSSTENERTTYVVEAENGQEVLFRQIAGALAKRIRFYLEIGDPVEQGKEFGFIRFGSRCDVFLPLDAKVEVKIGDKTKGGLTPVARFV